MDIEASNLNANFGIAFSYCIKKQHGKVYGRALTKRELSRGLLDKYLIRDCVKDMRRFDRLIVYYGGTRRFDTPFLRSRALYWDLDFPEWQELKITDAYDMVRNRMKLHRSSLQAACEFLRITCKRHPLDGSVWFKAMVGNKKALDYIFKHNIEDVVATEKLWERLEGFAPLRDTSI